MNDTRPIFGSRAAFGLGAALLLALAGVLAFRLLESRQPHEQIIQPTAVGDRAYYQVSEDTGADSPLLVFNGRPLYVARPWVKSWDGRMLAAGRDDSGRHTLYRTTNPKLAAAARAGAYFLKLRTSTYLELTTDPEAVEPFSWDDLPMDPDAVDETEPEHDDDQE